MLWTVSTEPGDCKSGHVGRWVYISTIAGVISYVYQNCTFLSHCYPSWLCGRIKFFPNKSTKDFKAHQNLMMVVTRQGPLEPFPREWAQRLVNPGEQILTSKYHKFCLSLTGLVCRLLTFGVFWGGCALLAKLSLLNVSSAHLSTNPLYHQFFHTEFLLHHSFKKDMKRTASFLLLSSKRLLCSWPL